MRASSILLLLAAGCGPVVQPPEGTDTEPAADTGSSSEAPPPPNTTSTTTASTTTSSPPTTTSDGTTAGSETTGDLFLIMPDGGGGEHCMCDLFAQDCPPEEKCTPWNEDGGDVLDCSRCSDIAPQPRGLGETCTVEGSATSGLDDCDLGLLCWDVDPDTLQGTCVALCAGSEADPQCDAPNECLLANDGYLIVCLPPCDPLTFGSCPDGEACVPSLDAFVCAPSPAPAGSGPCELGMIPSACGIGSVCAPAELVPSCDSLENGCCTPTCSLAADPCGELGLVCSSWWGPDPAPAGYEDVGFCALP